MVLKSKVEKSHSQPKCFICLEDSFLLNFLTVYCFEYFNLFVFCCWWCFSWEAFQSQPEKKILGCFLRVDLNKSVWSSSSPSHRRQWLSVQLILVIQVKCNFNLDLLTLWLCKMMFSQFKFFPVFSLFLVIRCSLESGKLLQEAPFTCIFVREQGSNLGNREEGNKYFINKSHYSWVYLWKGGGHLKNINCRCLVMLFWIILIFCFLASALSVLTLLPLLFHPVENSPVVSVSHHITADWVFCYFYSILLIPLLSSWIAVGIFSCHSSFSFVCSSTQTQAHKHTCPHTHWLSPTFTGGIVCKATGSSLGSFLIT